MRNLLADSNKQNQDYQRALVQLCGDGILQPSKLDTPDKITAARAKLVQLRSLSENFEKSRLALLDDGTTRIGALPIPVGERTAALNAYQTNAGKQRSLVEQAADLDRQFISIAEQMVDFMEARLGKFNVAGNTAYFDDAADVSQYNELWVHIKETVAKDQQIIQQSQQFAQQSLKTMEQICNTQ
jgi:hypothetical protein